MNRNVGYNLRILWMINEKAVFILSYYIFSPYKYPLIQRNTSTANTASNKIIIIGLFDIS